MGTETRVGIFVLLLIAMIAGASLKLGKWNFGKQAGYSLYADFETASFIEPRSAILFSGIEVGTVVRIDLIEGKGRVSMWIEPNVQIPENVIIWQRLQGFVGLKYLEIALSKTEPPGRILKDGEAIRDARLSPIDSASENLDAVSINIKQLTDSLNQTFSQERGGQALNEILVNLNRLTDTLTKTLEGRDQQIEQIMSNLQTFSKNIAHLSSQNQAVLNQTFENLPNISKRFERISQDLETITSNISKIIEKNSSSIEKTTNMAQETGEQLNRTLTSVANITERIETGQGTVGKLLRDEETIDNLNETIEGINEFLLKARTLKTHLAFHSEYLLSSKDAKNYLALRLQPKPDKYYQIELVNSPAGGPTSEITTHTRFLDKDGNEISDYTTIEEITRTGTRFSFQLAKRYGAVTLRGGLIENTGGIGFDYTPLENTLSLAFEGYDFGAPTRPHLKSSVKLTLFKHLNLFGGVDDFINRNISTIDDVNFFVGAGIAFEDSDITTLLTSVPLPAF